MIHNPILPGCFPDPSFCRAGDDYYIVSSTFEWFPGIPIHHSRDLVNWRLIGHILDRHSLLDLRGIPDSAGVWAPSLSFHDDVFWLIYTNVRTREGVYKDCPAYLTTAPNILGPWTDPTPVGSCGFDPSLFHDDDGRKWLLNIQWDPRKGHSRFGGIVLQEYDHNAKRLVGPLRKILQKTELTEGPNIYKKDGWYYLMLAEGGTGWNHGISMARSRSIDGPYELDPLPAVLTTRGDDAWPLQKAGHGEIVQTQSGEWYMAHLCSRPVGPERRCILGRETALQRVVWSKDDWLRLAQGGDKPAVDLPAPAGLSAQPWPNSSDRDDFDGRALCAHWQSLRAQADESWASLTARPGWLRLTGRESLSSLFEQSLVARRLTSVQSRIETCVEFEPTHFSQRAGLICWYDTKTHYYLRVTHHETKGRVLGITLADDTAYDELDESEIDVNDWPRYYLRAQFDNTQMQFLASPDGNTWRPIGPALDATRLSDDYGRGLHFTGAFVGLCVQDLNGNRTSADFDYFEVTNLDH